jgi:hypothetical protein
MLSVFNAPSRAATRVQCTFAFGESGEPVTARAAGKGFPTPDGYIAAIAAAQGFAVASRDTSAFKAAGLPVIDPWTVTR